jgi:tetratricopeptide (TPR) repeat protein
MSKAGDYLERAIALDPGYAAAHSALGFHFNILALLGLRPARDAHPPARAECRKALAIDPSLADALAMLGWIAAAYDAERLFRSALWRFRVGAGREAESVFISRSSLRPNRADNQKPETRNEKLYV